MTLFTCEIVVFNDNNEISARSLAFYFSSIYRGVRPGFQATKTGCVDGTFDGLFTWYDKKGREKIFRKCSK